MFTLRVFIFAPLGENKHTKKTEYHAAAGKGCLLGRLETKPAGRQDAAIITQH
jgi:hypothetical protein